MLLSQHHDAAWGAEGMLFVVVPLTWHRTWKTATSSNTSVPQSTHGHPYQHSPICSVSSPALETPPFSWWRIGWVWSNLDSYEYLTSPERGNAKGFGPSGYLVHPNGWLWVGSLVHNSGVYAIKPIQPHVSMRVVVMFTVASGWLSCFLFFRATPSEWDVDLLIKLSPLLPGGGFSYNAFISDYLGLFRVAL